MKKEILKEDQLQEEERKHLLVKMSIRDRETLRRFGQAPSKIAANLRIRILRGWFLLPAKDGNNNLSSIHDLERKIKLPTTPATRMILEDVANKYNITMQEVVLGAIRFEAKQKGVFEGMGVDTQDAYYEV